MRETVLGTCSICGGRVTVPLVWWGVVPPAPTCQDCGAKRRAHGPLIDMAPESSKTRTAEWVVTTNTDGSAAVFHDSYADALKHVLSKERNG
jgi:hypothetical protein